MGLIKFALLTTFLLPFLAWGGKIDGTLYQDGQPVTGKQADLTEVARYPWGLYSVVVEKIDWDDPEISQLWEQYGFVERVQIRDGSGQVLREIRNLVARKEELHGFPPGGLGGSEIEVNFVEMAGGGLPELNIEAYSGGAHCCEVDYYFTQDGGLRNLLIFVGGNSEGPKPRDLNGDGRPEFIVGSDVLANFGELCYACSPWVQMVIGWDGKAYRDQTKAYPQLARKLAQGYRAEFLKLLSDPKLRERVFENFWPGYEDGAALGYTSRGFR
jgi:hypothetical protein